MVAYSPRDVAGVVWVLAKNCARLGGMEAAAEGTVTAASVSGLTTLAQYLLVGDSFPTHIAS